MLIFIIEQGNGNFIYFICLAFIKYIMLNQIWLEDISKVRCNII